MNLFLIWSHYSIFNYGLIIIHYTVMAKRKPDGNLKVFLISILSFPSPGSLLFLAIPAPPPPRHRCYYFCSLSSSKCG